MKIMNNAAPSVLSYSEAENYDGNFFFYDHDLSEHDLGKTSKMNYCVYCGTLQERSCVEGFQYLFICRNCGWWQIIAGGGAFGTKRCNVHRGQLKRYPIDALEVPLKSLREYLRKHPKDVALVNPTAFERLVGDCLKDMYAPCDVVHVGGTGDRGVDLLLIRSNESPWLIQVKRRSDLSTNEGVCAVRALNGVLLRENLAKGMVITTASEFTKAAVKETQIKTPLYETYDMKLFSYPNLVELFNVQPQQPYEPWLEYLKGP